MADFATNFLAGHMGARNQMRDDQQQANRNALVPLQREQMQLRNDSLRQSMAINAEKMAMARRETAERTAEALRTEADAEKLRAAVDQGKSLLATVAAGGPGADQAWQMLAAGLGNPDLELNRDTFALAGEIAGGIDDALMSAASNAAFGAPEPEAPASFRALEMRADAANLPPGSPERAEFMRTAGRESDSTVTRFVGADGQEVYIGPASGLAGGGVGTDPNMTATPRDPATTARGMSKNDVAALGEYRTAADSAQSLYSIADNMLTILPSVGYTGPGSALYGMADRAIEGITGRGGLPGSAAAREVFDSMTTEAQLTFTEKTKGAITEAEMALFRAAVANSNNTPDGNRLLAKMMRAGAQRAQTQAAFMEEWASRRGSLEGAQRAWGDYIRNNPILRQAENGGVVVAPEGDWNAAIDERTGADPFDFSNMTDAQLRAIAEGRE